MRGGGRAGGSGLCSNFTYWNTAFELIVVKYSLIVLGEGSLF